MPADAFTVSASVAITVIGAAVSYGVLRQSLADAREKVAELAARVKALEDDRVANEGRWAKIEQRLDAIAESVKAIRDYLGKNDNILT